MAGGGGGGVVQPFKEGVGHEQFYPEGGGCKFKKTHDFPIL